VFKTNSFHKVRLLNPCLVEKVRILKPFEVIQ
jgi:hypothetical protein